jgi:amidohydrolase
MLWDPFVMYDERFLNQRRGGRESWRIVVLVGMIVSVVALLVICGRSLEEGQDRGIQVRRQRAAKKPKPKEESLLLPSEDLPLLARSGAISRVRRRESRFSRPIWRRVQAMEADLQILRRKLHKLPELANREGRTAAMIRSALKELGVEAKTVAGTGVVALIRGSRPGPVVALRAAMDGVAVEEKSGLEYASMEKARFMRRLVPVSHAAGHDFEMAMLLGVAEIVSDLRRHLPGTVKLIFQPASEGPPPGERGGARAMIADGVLAAPSVNALFAVKLQPQLRVTEIAIDTSTGGGGVARFEILLTSPSRGACRRPGPRCPDLIAAAAQLVLNLRNIPHSRMNAAGRLLITVGAIHGGSSGDMLPTRLTIKGTIRWRRILDRNIAMHLVRRAAVAAAAVSGARARATFGHGGILIGNNPRLAHWTLGTAVRVLRRRGIRIAAVPPVTDSGFDRFRRRVPSVLVQLGSSTAGRKPTRIRTPGFVADEASLAVGVNLLSNLVVDYLLAASGDLRSVGQLPRRARRPKRRAMTPVNGMTSPPTDMMRSVAPAAPARP